MLAADACGIPMRQRAIHAVMQKNDIPLNSHLDSNPINTLDMSCNRIYWNMSGYDFRYKAMKKKFDSLYGVTPLFYCRAPGRVNIIGKFYCLLFVLFFIVY